MLIIVRYIKYSGEVEFSIVEKFVGPKLFYCYAEGLTNSK